ncbi:hypothetical protein [Fulvimonas soli]|uniref:Antibiotic biosynthesis monooxygenase n=1 Tax=Fulvimonas soli TaxID=155197 RepID=A0A316IIM8_9GAMM|nr:hypothetical protein [Fulvimonas soli]PWK92750.1 hypothetical protein C7456_10182 [Fulvimonas soli]TNY28029.1 hypothetical protein BV497_00020 [Fulvimonas soli]
MRCSSAAAAGRPTYALERAPSFGTPLEERKPSATVQVGYFHLRPGTEARFRRALEAAHAALARLPGAPAHTWYRLVAGGDQPQYLLMVARADWASYDRFDRDVPALLAGDADALAAFAAAVAAVETESWRYRADLSNLP